MEERITFEKLITDPFVKKALHEIGIVEPTPIQERAIPLVQSGKDVVGQSSTGSGKTFAFAVPIVEQIKTTEGLQAIVLVPTRELCEQVADECSKVTRYKSVYVLKVYGGVSIEGQIRNIPKANIIIGTPGRVKDVLQRRVLRLDTIKFFVLDEADKMLDMGFIEDVEFILKATPTKRQTLMFSATMPKEVMHIVNKHMRAPEWIKTKEQVEQTLLKQYYYDVPIRDRFHLLVHLLKEEKAPYAIVFCGTRRSVDLVAYNLNKNGLEAKAIHGGLTQSKRKQVMESFQGKKTEILVASDIAARGLDIKMLTHVYNFDVPKTPKEYVHRVGRTARAGEEGIAITLVSHKDYDNFRRVLDEPSLKIEKLPLPKFQIVEFQPFMPRQFTGRQRQHGSGFGQQRRFPPRHQRR
ncbi:MAG TPA: DEAD/DEAH box helicase [Candidatus Nanoarchaeia archaeon]|nr:DEAD/DEAH box helicase [Candidatus Nanoarchaeia archaeon]